MLPKRSAIGQAQSRSGLQESSRRGGPGPISPTFVHLRRLERTRIVPPGPTLPANTLGGGGGTVQNLTTHTAKCLACPRHAVGGGVEGCRAALASSALRRYRTRSPVLVRAAPAILREADHGSVGPSDCARHVGGFDRCCPGSGHFPGAVRGGATQGSPCAYVAPRVAGAGDPATTWGDPATKMGDSATTVSGNPAT